MVQATYAVGEAGKAEGVLRGTLVESGAVLYCG